MKCIILTILACSAMVVQSHPFLGLDVAAGIGNGLASAVGTVNTGLGSGGLAQIASKHIEQGSNAAANQYNAAANGVHDEGFHKRGKKKSHNRGHHHSRATKVSHAENSDDHDVGGSSIIDKAAHSAGAYNKQSSGAANYDNNYEGDSEYSQKGY